LLLRLESKYLSQAALEEFIVMANPVSGFYNGNISHHSLSAFTGMDVSTDLIELGRTPITVVCAGAKSILDIARTLEVLV
jgi:pseudouridine-5'-phosphate glycosidase/pseudouridine kinase